MHVRSGKRLPSPDSQLHAHVTGISLHVMVNRPHLIPHRRQRITFFLNLGQLLRFQVVPPGTKLVNPLPVILPTLHVPFIPTHLEVDRRKVHHGQHVLQFPGERLRDNRSHVMHFPRVAGTRSFRFLFRFCHVPVPIAKTHVLGVRNDKSRRLDPLFFVPNGSPSRIKHGTFIVHPVLHVQYIRVMTLHDIQILHPAFRCYRTPILGHIPTILQRITFDHFPVHPAHRNLQGNNLRKFTVIKDNFVQIFCIFIQNHRLIFPLHPGFLGIQYREMPDITDHVFIQSLELDLLGC